MYQNIWCEKRGGNQVEVHLWDDVAGYQNFIFRYGKWKFYNL